MLGEPESWSFVGEANFSGQGCLTEARRIERGAMNGKASNRHSAIPRAIMISLRDFDFPEGESLSEEERALLEKLRTCEDIVRELGQLGARRFPRGVGQGVRRGLRA